MKRCYLSCCLMTLVMVALPGCGTKAKTEDNSGPRVTQGNIDTSVGPMQPSVGGSAVAPPK